jgi:hypothetical protein
MEERTAILAKLSCMSLVRSFLGLELITVYFEPRRYKNSFEFVDKCVELKLE